MNSTFPVTGLLPSLDSSTGGPGGEALHTGQRTEPLLGSLCTGYGGLVDLGVAAALGGAGLAWTADNAPDVARLLKARFPGVANLGDLRAVDWTRVARVDVLTAGFPCQDISAAGRGAGIEKGTRSNVWTFVMDAVRCLEPSLAVFENVATLRWKGRGLDTVLADLAEAGYDANWVSVCACDIGAPHRRERVFIAAHPRGLHPAPGGFGAGAAPRQGPPGRAARHHLPTVSHSASWNCVLHPHTRWGDVADAACQRHSQGQPEPARQPQRPHPDLRNRASADPANLRCVRPRPARNGWHGPADRDRAAPHPAGLGHRHPGPPSRARISSTAVAGDSSAVVWGPYAPAIDRWERVFGRPAPHPTEPGTRGQPRLAARFVEWLMGLDPGWVTDPALGLSRTAQLRALGNGVVPQQAHAAVTVLLADIAATIPELDQET